MLLYQYLNVNCYADDRVFYASGATTTQAVTHLQAACDAFHVAFVNHRLVLNAKKTKCMNFYIRIKY